MRHISLQRALCVAYLLGVVGVASLPQLTASHRGAWYIVGHLSLSILMLGVWRMSVRRPDPFAVIATGVLSRLLLLGVDPFTTTDVERYLWDGHVALSGADPYSIRPNEAPLTLRAAWPLPSMNGDYVTLYPPLAIAVFSVCAALGPEHGVWAWKAMVTLASIGTLWLGATLLRQRGREQHLALLSLSPLLVLEAGIGGHLDALSTLCIVGALWLHARGRTVVAGTVLGLGTLTKLLPALVLFAIIARDRRRSVHVGLAFAATVFGGYVLAWWLGLRPFGSLATFFRSWRFGSPIHDAVTQLGLDPMGALAIALMALVALAWSAWRAQGTDITALSRRLIAIALLASPVVFPWYLSALAVLVAFAPSWWLLGWITAAPLTYEVIDAPTWTPATWPLWVMGAALVAGAALDWRRARVSRANGIAGHLHELRDSPSRTDAVANTDGCQQSLDINAMAPRHET